MRRSLGHRPLSDDSGPRDAAGSRHPLALTNTALLNATTTSLPCSAASSGPWEAGEPGETHGAPRQPGVSRSPRPGASPWRYFSQPLPQGSSVEPDQPDRPGRSGALCCKRSTVSRVLLSLTEGEPGGCWRSLCCQPGASGVHSAYPVNIHGPEIANDFWKRKALLLSLGQVLRSLLRAQLLFLTSLTAKQAENGL
ncbi:unnamed protein product [Coccothraustes coccothraustes]